MSHEAAGGSKERLAILSFNILSIITRQRLCGPDAESTSTVPEASPNVTVDMAEKQDDRSKAIVGKTILLLRCLSPDQFIVSMRDCASADS